MFQNEKLCLKKHMVEVNVGGKVIINPVLESKGGNLFQVSALVVK